MFVLFTVTNSIAIIAVIITLTFIVSVIDHETLTALHFIGNCSNYKVTAISNEMSTVSGDNACNSHAVSSGASFILPFGISSFFVVITGCKATGKRP
jgi:hypothetical protein